MTSWSPRSTVVFGMVVANFQRSCSTSALQIHEFTSAFRLIGSTMAPCSLGSTCHPFGFTGFIPTSSLSVIVLPPPWTSRPVAARTPPLFLLHWGPPSLQLQCRPHSHLLRLSLPSPQLHLGPRIPQLHIGSPVQWCYPGFSSPLAPPWSSISPVPSRHPTPLAPPWSLPCLNIS